MLLKVDLPEGPFIADVGFGACVMDAPLEFKTGVDQRTAMGTHRLSEADEPSGSAPSSQKAGA